MISSMTAYSNAVAELENGRLTIEIRSVNHRYLDLNFRLPEAFRCLESQLREQVTPFIKRGKVEIFIKWSAITASNATTVNQTALQTLLSLSSALAQQDVKLTPLDPLAVLAWPGVLQEKPFSVAAIQPKVIETLQMALSDLQAVRQREGEKLQHYLQENLDQLMQCREQVLPLVPELVAHQREKLLRQFSALEIQADEARFAQEIALYAQRVDVKEELDRLQAHIDEVTRLLQKGGVIGRRLDFFMQELHREVNTLGSKSASTISSHKAVDMKVLIEQMREQIQNIE